MPRLFNRKLECKVLSSSQFTGTSVAEGLEAGLGLNVGSAVIQTDVLTVSNLDMSFKISKSFKNTPNTCELTIYNLNKNHRDQLGEADDTRVEISAGYEGEDIRGSIAAAAGFGGVRQPVAFGLLFAGDIRDISSSYDGEDWATSLDSADGEKSKRKARINRSFPPGTTLPIVMREAGIALGLGLGNLNVTAADPSLRMVEASPVFLHGVTLSGNAWKEFDRIVKSAGLEWSIQDGVIQLSRYDEPLQDFTIRLSPDTGLLGSPTVSSKGIAKIRTLMIPDLVPGRGIILESENANGPFLCKVCTYSGDNFGGSWYVDIEAAQLSTNTAGEVIIP